MTVASPRPRPQRQGLTDFTLAVTRDDVAAIHAAQGGPDWLLADREAGFDAFEALPAETNDLYTTYIDLRGASLGATELHRAPVVEPSTVDLSSGASAQLVISDGDLTGTAISAEAAAADVELTTLADYLERRPERARELLDNATTLPKDDRFAQLTRATWSQGVVLDVPAGVQLADPILIRWVTGRPGRAVVGRTFIVLGEGSNVRVLEELVGRDDATRFDATDAPQSFLAGTLEVHLGRDAHLEVASLQELPETTIAFQHRNAVIGEGATLHWALAQLGSRLVRSRVDNRLEGDRSEVEQVEIVFGGDEQLFDLTSYTRHIGRDTTGNLLSKGALMDREDRGRHR